jgi:hypothetical protein
MNKSQLDLMVMAGHDKVTGQRVWAVQSTSRSKAKGFPVFHVLTWIANDARWACPCESRKPCVHMRFASEASQREQERIDAAFDALTAIHFGLDSEEHLAELATRYLDDRHDYETPSMMLQEPIIARNDTGSRLYRETPKLIGGWDGVVNGRDERLLDAYDKTLPLAERVREVM